MSYAVDDRFFKRIFRVLTYPGSVGCLSDIGSSVFLTRAYHEKIVFKFFSMETVFTSIWENSCLGDY